MINLVLYTTGCPKCRIIERKLDEQNIPYTKITDVDRMGHMGIQSVPVLSIDGNLYNFNDAIAWLSRAEANV